MPTVRGVYYANPVTGEVGLWVMLQNGQIIGRTDAQIAAFLGKTGSDSTKLARLKAAAEAYIQPYLETRIPLAQLTAQEQADVAAGLWPNYRVDGTDVVVTMDRVIITGLSVSPVSWQIEIQSAASAAVSQ